MKRKKVLLIVFLFGVIAILIYSYFFFYILSFKEVFLAPDGSTTVYYVSPLGNDSASGNFTNPWKTIERAFDRVAIGASFNFSSGNLSGAYSFDGKDDFVSYYIP